MFSKGEAGLLREAPVSEEIQRAEVKTYYIRNEKEITWHVYGLRDSSDIQWFGEIILFSPRSQNHRQTDLFDFTERKCMKLIKLTKTVCLCQAEGKHET